MTTELAKQLKDAGFPLKFKSIEGEGPTWTATEPALSELIAACLTLIPDKFLDISSRDYGEFQWRVTSSWKMVAGNTPEEAVAKLWLALNTKS